jgi:hypothetical protein
VATGRVASRRGPNKAVLVFGPFPRKAENLGHVASLDPMKGTPTGLSSSVPSAMGGIRLAIIYYNHMAKLDRLTLVTEFNLIYHMSTANYGTNKATLSKTD